MRERDMIVMEERTNERWEIQFDEHMMASSFTASYQDDVGA